MAYFKLEKKDLWTAAFTSGVDEVIEAMISPKSVKDFEKSQPKLLSLISAAHSHGNNLKTNLA